MLTFKHSFNRSNVFSQTCFSFVYKLNIFSFKFLLLKVLQKSKENVNYYDENWKTGRNTRLTLKIDVVENMLRKVS